MYSKLNNSALWNNFTTQWKSNAPSPFRILFQMNSAKIWNSISVSSPQEIWSPIYSSVKSDPCSNASGNACLAIDFQKKIKWYVPSCFESNDFLRSPKCRFSIPRFRAFNSEGLLLTTVLHCDRWFGGLTDVSRNKMDFYYWGTNPILRAIQGSTESYYMEYFFYCKWFSWDLMRK